MASYRPIGSMAPGMMTSRKEKGGGGPDDPRDRERPELPPELPPGTPGTPPEGPITFPLPTPPEGVPPEGPAAPAPTMPPPGAGSPFQPGNPLASRPFRTPAFFTNRYVGGPPEATARPGPGSPAAPAGRPQLDDEMLRSLVARFSGGGMIR